MNEIMQPWQFAVMIEYGRIQHGTVSDSKEDTVRLSGQTESELSKGGCSIIQFIPKVVGGRDPCIPAINGREAL